MKKLLFLALVSSGLCCVDGGFAQEASSAEDRVAKDAAVSESKSDATKKFCHAEIADAAVALGFDVSKFEAIDRKFTSLLKREKIAGVSAFVSKQGKEVFYGQWGFQDREEKTPLTRETIFRIYSMTKPITSVAAMQLVEKGKIDLDAPLSTYLPELADLKVLESDGEETKQVDPDRQVTTRDLLRHTSGLTYGFFGNTEVDQAYRRKGILNRESTIKETVKALSSIPLLYQPGTKFHYSVSTDVLGRVIEVASGETLADYFKNHIFKPLGMNSTFFSVPNDQQDRFAQMYMARGRNPLQPAPKSSSARFLNESNTFYSGGGGLCSTIEDYATFCHMLVGKGKHKGTQILASETIDKMFSNQLGGIGKQSTWQFKFGLGFRLFPEGDMGWGGAAGTKFWVNPEKETVLIYMIQVLPNEGLQYGDYFRKEVYSALE